MMRTGIFWWSATFLLCLTMAAGTLWANPELNQPLMMKLWENGPPGGVAPGLAEESINARGSVINVRDPGIAVHLPPETERTGLALIVCPGGSYREIGAFVDGMGAVPYFVPKGVAVIVLKYRTRPPSRNVAADALADARRAVKLVRHHAIEWGIDPARVGMLGSSAGSHLVLNAATHPVPGEADAEDPVERFGSRPDFIAMLCPWPNGQSPEDFPIGKESPPAFICAALDDPIAPVAFSKGIMEAYQTAGTQAALWTVESGGHTAFKQRKGEGRKWSENLVRWLQEQKLWKEPPQ